jgi:UDP-glucose:(heptosyl)LPS alpha-1,3-glucosyltransferase
MKIALIIERFDPLRGTAEHLAVWLAGRLATAGHEVHVICHDVRRRLDTFQAAHRGAAFDAAMSAHSHQGDAILNLPEGVAIHRLRGPRLSNVNGFRVFGQRAAKWCSENKPDVVHSFSIAFTGDIYHPELGVFAVRQQQMIAAQGGRTSSRLERWRVKLSPVQRALVLLERQALAKRSKLPGKIICVCGMIKEQLKEAYGVAEARMVVLENPRMDAPELLNGKQDDRTFFRAHYGFTKRDRVALFVGHDFRRKGLQFAIDAVARTRPAWNMLIVGQGKVRPFYEQVREQLLEERIKFVGPTAAVKQMYAVADALVLPTFYDPVGQVATEALRCGLPVISTKYLGSADAIVLHRAGAIVDDPTATAAMALALDQLPLQDREALARRARAAAAGTAPAKYVEAIELLYRETNAGRSKTNRSE